MPRLPASPREISLVTIPRSARTFLVLVVLVLSAVAALSVASPASAATPCGKKVLADWFDNGRIDRLYPLNCYEEAIDAIPADLRDYADAEEIITRALQAALNGNLAPGGADPTPDDSDPGGTGNGGNGGSATARATAPATRRKPHQASTRQTRRRCPSRCSCSAACRSRCSQQVGLVTSRAVARLRMPTTTATTR